MSTQATYTTFLPILGLAATVFMNIYTKPPSCWVMQNCTTLFTMYFLFCLSRSISPSFSLKFSHVCHVMSTLALIFCQSNLIARAKTNESVKKMYQAVEKYMNQNHYYYPVNYRSGEVIRYSIDSLQAFWPGFQVLLGDLSPAIRSHYNFWLIWKKLAAFILPFPLLQFDLLFPSPFPFPFSLSRMKFLPEVILNPSKNCQVDKWNDDWPLRPEFIESTFFLYTATQHPFYLHVANNIIQNLQVPPSRPPLLSHPLYFSLAFLHFLLLSLFFFSSSFFFF